MSSQTPPNGDPEPVPSLPGAPPPPPRDQEQRVSTRPSTAPPTGPATRAPLPPRPPTTQPSKRLEPDKTLKGRITHEEYSEDEKFSNKSSEGRGSEDGSTGGEDTPSEDIEETLEDESGSVIGRKRAAPPARLLNDKERKQRHDDWARPLAVREDHVFDDVPAAYKNSFRKQKHPLK
ncbi:hypothetical protein C8Q79DRAFT_1007364 [Trametes meyenii]|nr:hypothetical protein C8Q79DRAFT_1007364 [Trametes meyenii]